MEDHDNNIYSDVLVKYIYSNTLPSVLLNSNNTAKRYREKGCSECQISVRLHVSRMKKTSYSTTSNTLKMQLLLLRDPHRKCVPTVRDRIQSAYGNFPSSMEAFLKMKF